MLFATCFDHVLHAGGVACHASYTAHDCVRGRVRSLVAAVCVALWAAFVAALLEVLLYWHVGVPALHL